MERGCLTADSDDPYRDLAEQLVGQAVVAVHEAGKWDVVLEFENSKTLRVYDAKWSIREPDD